MTEAISFVKLANDPDQVYRVLFIGLGIGGFQLLLTDGQAFTSDSIWSMRVATAEEFSNRKNKPEEKSNDK